MIIQNGTDKLIKVSTLPADEQADYGMCFEKYGEDIVLELAEDMYYTYALYKAGQEPGDIRVKYEPDMFLKSMKHVYSAGCAVAYDENYVNVAVLSNMANTYVHRYEYSGGVDCTFLDSYDCIVLHECNEYSVELCQTALRFWKGKRLVFMGKSWERMIPMLPDMNLDCWYVESVTQEQYDEMTAGMKTLNVIFGIPHSEPMDRYEQGIMYYDEIMSFVFLFSRYKELGDKNPDKNFFVVDGYYDDIGLFTIFSKATAIAKYAKSKGMIPVMRITMSNKSCYSNYKKDDIWGKFYEQPEGYTLDEVMSSKHVFFSCGLYNGSVQTNIMNALSADTEDLRWPDGIYNSAVREYIDERIRKFLPKPSKTLGVLARGTDYVNTHLFNHPIHATKEMLCDKIDETIRNSNGTLEYIYLATEDAEYCRYFKERYKERLTYTDQERYVTEEDECLGQLHSKQDNKRDGFLYGVEYITSIYLLSKCDSLIASGGCAGVWEAVRQNEGRYRSTYIFDLGVNS